MSKPENNGVTPVAGRARCCCPMTGTLALVLSPLFLQPSPSMVSSSAPGRLPRCIVLLLRAHLENKATSSKSPSLHGGRAVWARTCTGSCSFLDEDKDLFYLPSTILNTRLKAKQKKERVSSVGDLGKVGQQPRNMIDWNTRGRLPSIQTSPQVHGLSDNMKKKHFHHICVCT